MSPLAPPPVELSAKLTEGERRRLGDTRISPSVVGEGLAPPAALSPRRGTSDRARTPRQFFSPAIALCDFLISRNIEMCGFWSVQHIEMCDFLWENLAEKCGGALNEHNAALLPRKKQRLSPLLLCFSLYVSVRSSDRSACAAYLIRPRRRACRGRRACRRSRGPRPGSGASTRTPP